MTSNPSLTEIARQIVEGQATDDLQFKIVLGVLAILTGLIFWYVKPYLGERGKLLALAETLRMRLDEIRQTTEAAENVRTRIAHSDWTTKEYKTLLRNKLEQLMAAAYKTMSATQTDADFQYENSNLKLTSDAPASEIRLLLAMYFDVLRPEVDKFLLIHSNFSIWLIGARTQLRKADLLVTHEKLDLDTLRSATSGIVTDSLIANQNQKYREAKEQELRIREVYVSEYAPLIQALGEALQNLELRSGLLMKEYIAPTNP